MATFYESLTNAQKLYSMYFIAKYESSWSWDGHNKSANQSYKDPVTLGIMQWSGPACCDWLTAMQTRDAALYAQMPANWRAWVAAGRDDWHWGNVSVMTDADTNAWKSAVAANLDAVKDFSQWYWVVNTSGESLKNDLDILETWGHLPDNPTLAQIRNVYFYLARYHNTGWNMKKIYDAYGWGGDLAAIRDATIRMYQSFSNFGIYGAGWVNAINDNYDLLTAWDGSIVPDFGQTGGYGNNDATSNPTGDDVYSYTVDAKYIDQYGESLALHMKDGKRILFYKANNVWLPRTGTVGSGDNSGSSQSGPSVTDWGMTPEVFAAVKEECLRFRNWGYSLDSDLFDNPTVTGVTNCSAWIRWLGRTYAPGSQMANMPYSYTGVMAETGRSIASGTKQTPFPYDLARPGDVLLVNWSWANPEFDHVELYLGTGAQGNDTGSECWGSGRAPCPHKTGSADYYVTQVYNWELRRINWF